MNKPKKPIRPVKPNKPSASVVRSVEIDMATLDRVMLDNIYEVIANKLRSELGLDATDDLRGARIYITEETGYTGDVFHRIYFDIAVKNDGYEKELERYKRAFSKYNDRIKEYNAKMTTYYNNISLWKKERAPKLKKLEAAALKREEKALSKKLLKLKDKISKL